MKRHKIVIAIAILESSIKSVYSAFAFVSQPMVCGVALERTNALQFMYVSKRCFFCITHRKPKMFGITDLFLVMLSLSAGQVNHTKNPEVLLIIFEARPDAAVQIASLVVAPSPVGCFFFTVLLVKFNSEIAPE